MRIDTPVKKLKGVGEKLENSLSNLGVYTVGDILLNFPRDYVQFPPAHKLTELIPDKKLAVEVRITTSPIMKKTKTMTITVLNVAHMGIRLEAIWFRSPFIKNSLPIGKTVILYGNVTLKNDVYHMEHPDIFSRDEYENISTGLYPVYSLTKGVTNKFLIKLVNEALLSDIKISDRIPDEIAEKYGFLDYSSSVNSIHFPSSMDSLIKARRRIVYNEFFEFIMALKIAKNNEIRAKNTFDILNIDHIDKYINSLSYELTGAQKRTIAEVISDFHSPYLASRLIQGDVGSGKTIVAFLAMLLISDSGYQSVLMAPTEVLARQHYESLIELLDNTGVKKEVVLLTGSLKASEKKKAYMSIANEKDAIVIGTHALIQEKVEYNNLGLVITDEQHRFGVKQRESFSNMGQTPHSIVMSATPIPRTLAIILYGELDISIMNELPQNRLPIKNCVVGEEYRSKTNAFIIKEVNASHQVYIICPLVEASEEIEAFNVTDYTENLRNTLPNNIRIELLHGKLKASEKNRIMDDFKDHKIDVLVSTTVIEVGVNVPNATVMVIENADRFGLAALHQLRGRVGRGDAQSYCIMMNSSDTERAKERLEIMNKSNDGFYIAEADLAMRGPGDFFGIRQSGDMAFNVADIYQDSELLKAAAADVDMLLARDGEEKWRLTDSQSLQL